uniref:Uncharacterized protein n=1 Tax=Chromera velia CCMP2878 TaxID=1169474 RepID=A0A0G4HWC6_9ALVE|eukprot:Cvel_32613.t1-p1 / transcript=Cvel_32613.t1 / gene=Cvel_32613 / organism=Chromera_velia_CCMP2878 / gene_product=hypothetical protein / transcript_product=hypothetical protein / location=Cvel_scaffold5114:3601-5879(+) / protein_length=364 / sequence_SO=supercontig / SO=protein_coding / is_pseudo=false
MKRFLSKTFLITFSLVIRTHARLIPTISALAPSSEAEEQTASSSPDEHQSISLLLLNSNATASSSEAAADEVGAVDQEKEEKDTLAKEVIEAYTPVKMDWFKGKDLYMFTPDGKRDSDKMMKLVELREAFLCRNVLGFEEDACLFDENKSPKVLKIPVEKDGKTFDCSIMALGSVTLLSDLDFTISCTGIKGSASGVLAVGNSSSASHRDLFNAETFAASGLFQRSRAEVLSAETEANNGTREGLCEASSPDSKCWDPIPGILFDTNFYTNAFGYQKKLGFDCSGRGGDAKTLGISVGAALFAVLRGAVEVTDAMHLMTKGSLAKDLNFWTAHMRKDKTPETVPCCEKTADAYTRFFEVSCPDA